VDLKSLKAKIEGDGRDDITFEWKGERFLAKQNTVAANRRIDTAAKRKDGTKDEGRFLVLLAAESIHYAESGEKVFDSKADIDFLERLPIGKGSFLATFIEAYGAVEARDARDAEAVF